MTCPLPTVLNVTAGISEASTAGGGLHQLIHSVGEQATLGRAKVASVLAVCGLVSMKNSLTGGVVQDKRPLNCAGSTALM